jgi:hypothetical protein
VNIFNFLVGSLDKTDLVLGKSNKARDTLKESVNLVVTNSNGHSDYIVIVLLFGGALV